MLDPKQQANVDQAAAYIVETFPPLWRNLYLALIKEGFKEFEAFDLTKAYIISQGTGDKRP